MKFNIEYVSGIWKYKAETRGLTMANFSLDIPMKAIKILSWKGEFDEAVSMKQEENMEFSSC